MAKVLCIYHSPCADGFGAAWVVRKALGDDVEFYPGVYGKPPPDVTGRHVVMVDFSYKRPSLMAMAHRARSILVLDHHKSAQEDLVGLISPPPTYESWRHVTTGMLSKSLQLTALFDMSRSGAGMAWDYFFPGQDRPQLINHIEDRDLWKFELEGTREIQEALFSWPYDFRIWDGLMQSPLRSLRQEGKALSRKHLKDVNELIGETRRIMKIGEYVVPVANIPYIMASDAGHIMAYTHPFAATYFDTPTGRKFSLRSNGGIDVSVVAVSYGGGGHRDAAGFVAPIGWEGEETE